MFEDEHPARRASLLSREYVQTHNRDGWLGLYADDAIIEDPIGKSYIDPEGRGHRGAAAREAFYDNFIANSDISIEIHHSFAAGSECANHITITIRMESEGKRYQQEVHGIFTYSVDEAGKLTAMRGYWDTEDPINALAEV
jgi:ketosteroid isomerase-like protein